MGTPGAKSLGRGVLELAGVLLQGLAEQQLQSGELGLPDAQPGACCSVGMQDRPGCAGGRRS